jgi:hypothetical protein
MATRARKVYAVEIQPGLITQAQIRRPANLEVICANARTYPFPPGITVAILLMRHCTHFASYWNKLKVAGCHSLITNARWRVGVEIIDLNAVRRPFSQVAMGWFACCCGATGFVQGPAEELTPGILNAIQEVRNCPKCERICKYNA